MQKGDLVDFENTVISEWERGETYGPVHLSGGNELQLLEIFKNVDDKDWVFTNHRAHYHALLKSQNKKWLLDEIIKKAHSSHIHSKKYKIVSSAIMGGNIPIALGVAMAIKLKGQNNKVWCFVGDMAAEMGIFHEALKYAIYQNLPITFVVEDNGLGCDTPTRKVWTNSSGGHNRTIGRMKRIANSHLIRYKYKRKYPHCGTGKWVTFKKKFKSTGDYNAIYKK